MLKKLLKNQALGYIIIQYATYVIQLVGGLWIAVSLGAFYLGIWGTINLVIQYMVQLDFGFPNAVKIEGAVGKYKEGYVASLVGNGFYMVGLLSSVIALIFVLNVYFGWNIGSKYNLQEYLLYIWLIGCSKYFCAIYVSIYRIYGELKEINFYKSVWPVAILPVVIFSGQAVLLENLIKTYTVTSLLSLVVFSWRSPVEINFNLKFRLWKLIQRRGQYIFLYASSLMFILLSLRTLIGSYYSVKQFGYFTFAFSLANALFLLLKTVAFLIHPKLLHNFNKNDGLQNKVLLDRLRNVYITGSYGIVFLGICIMPYFLYLFPEYKHSFEAFVVMALTIALQSNIFGYSGLILAKGGEKYMGILSIIALLLNVIFCFILIILFKVGFAGVAFGTMVAYLVYIFFVGRLGRKTMKYGIRFKEVLLDIFPLRLLLPYAFSVALFFCNVRNIYYGIPLIVFLVFNYKAIGDIYNTTIEMIKNPKLIDF